MGKEINIDLQYGKLPPQAISLEEAILGALILEQDAITKIDITPEIFYKDEHQKIFEVIQELDKNGKQIDLTIVTIALKDKGILGEVGGPSFITGLTSKVASSAHIEQHVETLKQYYIRRKLIQVGVEIQEKAYDPTAELSEITDVYDLAVSKIDNVLIGSNTGKMLSDVLKRLNTEIEDRVKKFNQGLLTGINTGFGPLNRITGGWQPGWLIILAARPSDGKTAIAINRFAVEAARTGSWVNVFSLEMEDISLGERLLLGHSDIDSYRLKLGSLDDTDWVSINNAWSKLESLPIFIDDTPYTPISHIRNVARKNKRNGKCDLIIVDYLQLAKAVSEKGKNREQEVAEMSKGLKALAKELQVPIIILSQLSREIERRSNKRPILSDLRESGSLEQDADIVIFPFRPSRYGITEDAQGQLIDNNQGILILAKNRHGEVGDIDFWHNSTMTDFSDVASSFSSLSSNVEFNHNDFNQ